MLVLFGFAILLPLVGSKQQPASQLPPGVGEDDRAAWEACLKKFNGVDGEGKVETGD